jgi:ADP-heptose:LPS heptosyltransferase
VSTHGGLGDKIMLTTNNPDECWYWRELAKHRGTFNFDFKVKPGRVTYDRTITAIADVEDAVIIEPHVKQTFSADNKDWGFERYQALVDSLPDVRFVQVVHHGLPALERVDTINTWSFEQAVAVIAGSRGLICGAGGLGHAAGALRKPAVILWGSYAPPEVLGYDFHENVTEPDPEGLGWRVSHPACRAAMQRISVQRVAQAVERAFNAVTTA